MNILIDNHHLDLTHSLNLLFEGRLGHTVYRQIGMSWADEGYWSVYNHPDTAKQYLMDGFIPKDGTPPLNGVSRIKNGVHVIRDEAHYSEQKAITLEQFKEMKFDIVIASIPQHIEPFKKLIRLYQPQAKFIFQQGNHFLQTDHYIKNGMIENLLSSTVEYPVPATLNVCWYHQEMSLDVFKPSEFSPRKNITSFVNLLPTTAKAYLYYMLKQEMQEYEFKSYGILCDDGIISGVDKIARIINQSMFGIHVKSGGDGAGHVIHNFYACGKPTIVSYDDYKDKQAGKLLVPDETCFVLDSIKDVQRVAEEIRKISPEKYEWMCQQAYKKFKEVVNYDEESEKIQEFLLHVLL